MAGENRPETPAVVFERQLAEAPQKFDFLQALRQLERLYREKPRIGEAPRVWEEIVILSQEPSLASPSGTTASFQPTTDEHPGHLACYVLGLFGPDGPLPLHLT